MLLLATAWHLLTRQRVYFLAAAGLVAIAFVVLTTRQETAWKDNLTIFTVAHEIAPNNAPVAKNLGRAHVQAAIQLDESGRCDEALPVFEEVTRQYPDDWFAWAGMGDCLVQLNDLPTAEQSLHRAADLSKNPRVNEQWQQVRARVSGSLPSPSK
jgi:tetratricopeptide (TPR) repeat protein